jgi:hypothetical protein
MAIINPHYAWPFRLGSVVEQDSTEEHLAAAAVVACTPRGHRADRPGFGVTQQLFAQGPLDLELLADEILASDSRLDVDADELIDLADATVRTVRLSTGSA